MTCGAIFDLDGTLLDTIGDLAAAGNAVCRENGWRQWTDREFQALVGHGMENLIRQMSPPEAQSPEKRAETLERFLDQYAAHCVDRTRPFPGMPELLGRFREWGVKMAVLSNKPDGFTRELMERFYPGVFDVVHGHRAGRPVKPDPSLGRETLKELGIPAEGTLFIGDSATDVLTGHNAGVRVCAVTWGYRPRASLGEADFLADTPGDLERLARAFWGFGTEL